MHQHGQGCEPNERENQNQGLEVPFETRVNIEKEDDHYDRYHRFAPSTQEPVMPPLGSSSIGMPERRPFAFAGFVGNWREW
jgi:hypothetical protein